MIVLYFAFWGVAFNGINAVWKDCSTRSVIHHQVGALGAMSLFLICNHYSRRVSMIHYINLLGQCKIDNPILYSRLQGEFATMNPALMKELKLCLGPDFNKTNVDDLIDSRTKEVPIS